MTQIQPSLDNVDRKSSGRPIQGIVVCCFPRDLHYLRICLASIRHWYPDVPISLLKDRSRGDFDTREMEQATNAKLCSTTHKGAGWGLTKLMAFWGGHERILMLDSDTVMLGPILEFLETFSEDFIVTGVHGEESDHRIYRDYIHCARVRDEFDPDYQYPGFGFNTGHLVLTRGLLSESDFESVLEFSDGSFQCRTPAGLFPYADQGLLNYVLAKAATDRRCTIRYADFWIWSGEKAAQNVSIADLKGRRGIPKMLHWAGTKRNLMRKMDRIDILRYFENMYYEKLTFGESRRFIHHVTRVAGIAARKLMKSFESSQK
jgi:hypothetical protein